jgi:cyclopropane-fatty-acyl-phospholipid synthase
MRRYMWPNSCLPSATVLINAAQEGSNGRFTLEGVENHAAHYIRTLREWGRRLEVRLTPSALGLSSAPSSMASTAVSSPCEDKDTIFKNISSVLTSTRSGVSDSQREATLLQTLPALTSADEAAFEALKRKWQYLFAYAGAGFSKGYITCTFFMHVIATFPLTDPLVRSYAHLYSPFGWTDGVNPQHDIRPSSFTSLFLTWR